jgi:hypothetical protein
MITYRGEMASIYNRSWLFRAALYVGLILIFMSVSLQEIGEQICHSFYSSSLG